MGDRAAETSGRAGEPRRREGSPVPDSSRQRMETVVGGDLSPVMLHTDAEAAAIAAGAGMRAVTQGRDVYFAAGAYRPGTLPGEALLAHELAHTRQQEGGAPTAVGPAPGSASDATLEGEADQAGLMAAMWLADSRAAQAARRPMISTGQGLRLQGCTDASYPEIEALPSREEYERRGELLPRPLGEGLVPLSATLEVSGGGQILVLDPSVLGGDVPADREPAPRTPPLPEIDLSAPALTTDQLSARLAVMEQRQSRIDTLTEDVPRGQVVVSLSLTFALIRQDLQLGAALVVLDPSAVAGGTAPAVEPWTPRTLSPLLPRAERVQQRVHDALVELAQLREHETQSYAPLQDTGFDLGGALAEIDTVRWAYARASDALLTDEEVTHLKAADESRGRLDMRLLQYLLRYHEQRTASGDEIAPAVAQMQDWASLMGAEVARLVATAEEIKTARQGGDPDLPDKEWQFARDAQLVATSLDALSEWDVALSAYELLKDNAGLWGMDAIDRIAGRMEQMKAASLSRDERYLRLLVRDHRGDPDVAAFYESIPDVIKASHLIIGFAILLVTAVVTAGVGVAISGFAAAAATTVEASALAAGAGASVAAGKAAVILQIGLVAKVGGEAVVFTLVHRGLASMVPGMEPKDPFLYDLVWNLALFGAMHGVGSVVQGAVGRSAWLRALAPRARAVVATGAKLTSAYATLQAYGLIRFLYEEERMMSLSEFGTMSAHNLAMLVGLSLGMAPFSTVLKGIEARAQRAGGATTAALLRFRQRYGEEFRLLDSERAHLQQQLAQRMEENPQATKDDVSDIDARAADLDLRLESLVERVLADPAVDLPALRTGVETVTAELQVTPVPELFGRMGLDPTVDLRSTGDVSTWSFAPGKGEAIRSFLVENTVPVSVDTVSGRQVYDAAVAGRGPVALVERAGAPVTAAPTVATPALDAVAAKDANARAGLDAVRGQTVVRDLVARLEARATAGETALVRTLLRGAGRLARARGEPGEGAAPGVREPAAGEAAREARAETFAAQRAHMLALDAALGDGKAATGFQNLMGAARFRTAQAGILAAAPPENVGPFLRAMADADIRGMTPEFYTGLARSRSACDLVDRYGGNLLLRLVNLQGGNPEAVRVARARADIERVLRGLDEAAARDPAAAATLKGRILKLRGNATFRALNALVGPRPRPGPAFEPNRSDPEWPTYVDRAEKYAREHPVEGRVVSRAEIEMRATLYQAVERARAGEFQDLTSAQRTEILDRFDELALSVRLDRQWISSTRGQLNEALALGRGRASVRTVWLLGKLIIQQVKGSTVPDGAYPPVRPEELVLDATGRRPVEQKARLWFEDKSYHLGGPVDAKGVSTRGRAAARKHAEEARQDLENLPPGSTICLRYASDPGAPTRNAMLDALFAEPGIVEVQFEGTPYTRTSR